MNVMGAKNLEMPVKRKRAKKGKITVYPDSHIAKIYSEGMKNGWDAALIAREAVASAMLEWQERLSKPAPEDE